MPFWLSAQAGYRIDVRYDEPLNTKVYLNRVMPLEIVCVDSAVVKKGKAVLKGKNALQPGNYHLCRRPEADDFAPILVEQSQKIMVSFSLDDVSVSSSPESNMYSEFHHNLFAAITLEELRQYVGNLTSVSPNSLASKYINFESEALFFLEREDADLSVQNILTFMSKYQERCYMYNSFWNILMDVVLQDVLEAKNLDLFFNHISPKSDVGQFMMKQLMLNYNRDGDLQADEMLIHLYDEYYQPNQLQLFGEDGERRLQKTIERKRRTQLGAVIPNMEVLTESGSKTSTNDIQRKYTVLWFWDPDCEDCQHETPILHQFYLENADTYDFEVFGVSITEDVDFWKEKSNEWSLSWINSCMGLGGYNYDFVDYLSLIATPASFLLDENHKIILRNFTPEQLQEYFENLDK